MRDSGYAIREAYYNALTAVLTVPVVDGKIDTLPVDGIFVAFGDQTENDKTNKSAFTHEVTVDIAIVYKRKATGSKKDVEEVSDQILQIVKPTPQTHGITIDSPFNITSVRYLTGLTVSVALDSANQFIQVKRLQFINRITQ
jgi:hypothetical protein